MRGQPWQQIPDTRSKARGRLNAATQLQPQPKFGVDAASLLLWRIN